LNHRESKAKTDKKKEAQKKTGLFVVLLKCWLQILQNLLTSIVAPARETEFGYLMQ